MTTKIFDMVRIITLKQQNFSQSDPVLIRQLKKIAVRSSPDPAKIGFSADLVFIRAHLCCTPLVASGGKTEANFNWIRTGSAFNFFEKWRIRLYQTEKIFIVKCDYSNLVEIFR